MKSMINGLDKPLLIITVILFAFGLVTIYSASNVTAFMLNEADPSRYFLKELLLFKDKKYKFKSLDLSLDKKAHEEFIEFKKTKVFNARKA